MLHDELHIIPLCTSPFKFDAHIVAYMHWTIGALHTVTQVCTVQQAACDATWISIYLSIQIHAGIHTYTNKLSCLRSLTAACFTTSSLELPCPAIPTSYSSPKTNKSLSYEGVTVAKILTPPIHSQRHGRSENPIISAAYSHLQNIVTQISSRAPFHVRSKRESEPSSRR